MGNKMKIVAIIPNREEFLACEIIKGLHILGVELISSSPLANIRNAYARCSPIDIGANDIPDTKEYSDDEIIEHAYSGTIDHYTTQVLGYRRYKRKSMTSLSPKDEWDYSTDSPL